MSLQQPVKRLLLGGLRWGPTRRVSRALVSWMLRGLTRPSRAGMSLPDGDGFEPIRLSNGICGWTYQPSAVGSTGTAFFLHGFGRNANSHREEAIRLHEYCGCAAVAIDLRGHANSAGVGIPTLGSLEATDLSIALDYAEQSRLREPYIAFGVSLGGMVAQRLGRVDPRLSGLFLSGVPGWAMCQGEPKFHPPWESKIHPPWL